jgi:hypothetical protein
MLEILRVYPTGLGTRGCVEDPCVTRTAFRPDRYTGTVFAGPGRPEGTRGCTRVNPYAQYRRGEPWRGYRPEFTVTHITTRKNFRLHLYRLFDRDISSLSRVNQPVKPSYVSNLSHSPASRRYPPHSSRAACVRYRLLYYFDRRFSHCDL